MNNCNCTPKCSPGRPVPTPVACKKPDKITLRIETIPATLGTDAEGQPNAPKLGAYFNTVVHYLANDAVYIYDSNGNYVLAEPGNYVELLKTVDGFAEAITELYSPGKIGYMVQTAEDLETLSPTVVPANEFVLVVADETHNDRPALYEYNANAGMFTFARLASPYYEKPFIDSAVANLQTNINNVLNKEMMDVEALQTNINTEVNAREVADKEEQEAREAEDTALNQRIDDIINSPDVRYIVDTYADLEALDKATIGDKDYARILQDETHDNASTYYQFSTASQEWSYVGQTGPYYTKEQVDTQVSELDEKIGAINTEKLNAMLEIKSLNDSLSLDENGQLSVVGGGSDVNLLTAYTANPAEGDVYNAAYVNSRLDKATNIILGDKSNAGFVSVHLGRYATGGTSTIAIGYASGGGPGGSNAQFLVAVGDGAKVPNGCHYSVAIGAKSLASRTSEVSIGSGGSSEIAPTRYLANVTAGELDTDAVNLKQLNDAIAALQAQIDELKGV